MRIKWLALGLALAAPGEVGAQAAGDAASEFGAREAVTGVSLSPDGETIAFLVPAAEKGTALLTLPVSGEGAPKRIFVADGDPNRVRYCRWASSKRLVCAIWGVVVSPEYGPLNTSRLIAVNADGTNLKMLSTKENEYSRGIQLDGGSVIDWLPDGGGEVLMARQYLPDDHLGTRIGSTKEGLGVDRLDTNTLKAIGLEAPRPNAIEYISDQRGTVRIMGSRDVAGATEQDTGIVHYAYRLSGARDWRPLSNVDFVHHTGFDPYAIDADRNLVYGFMLKDGRRALYTMLLDGSLNTDLVLSRPDVDVDGLLTIGPKRRVIGASYATDTRRTVYFDPALAKIAASLNKALPKQPLINVIGATPDEKKLLIAAGSDDDPGVFYVLNRANYQLHITFAVRPQLAGRTLATVKPMTYQAGDGTTIPAYLTLPPGRTNAKGLPAIVLPHGGPADRDEWGFDWLPQFYAAQGYAVLQPEFRGSSGYGEAWFQKNGFRSWRIAIGDVLDAGRWLIKEGIADPARLAVVGWSYGGYAALQAAATDPALFKAVVAVAPVTDLATLKAQSQYFTNHQIVSDFIGSGPEVRDGSPAQSAARIKAPVLLFHGTLDVNVGYRQSTLMDGKLAAAGVPHELVTYKGLDHQLEDSRARADMLRRSDAFLRKALRF